jgi:hypothetical protein
MRTHQKRGSLHTLGHSTVTRSSFGGKMSHQGLKTPLKVYFYQFVHGVWKPVHPQTSMAFYFQYAPLTCHSVFSWMAPVKATWESQCPKLKKVLKFLTHHFWAFQIPTSCSLAPTRHAALCTWKAPSPTPNSLPGYLLLILQDSVWIRFLQAAFPDCHSELVGALYQDLCPQIHRRHTAWCHNPSLSLLGHWAVLW